jgi:hypothetical protein
MSRFAPFVVAAGLAATTNARADRVRELDLGMLLTMDERIQSRAVAASITHTSDGLHLRGLIPGGVAFSSTEYCDELESDTMELATTTSSLSPMIEVGLRVGRDLMAGSTVALGPTYELTLGHVMPGNERHLALLVGFSRRR